MLIDFNGISTCQVLFVCLFLFLFIFYSCFRRSCLFLVLIFVFDFLGWEGVEIQSHYDVHFWTKALGKGTNPLIPELLLFYKDCFTMKVDMPLQKETKPIRSIQLTPGRSGPGSNCNEVLLHTLQSSCNGASPSNAGKEQVMFLVRIKPRKC